MLGIEIEGLLKELEEKDAEINFLKMENDRLEGKIADLKSDLRSAEEELYCLEQEASTYKDMAGL